MQLTVGRTERAPHDARPSRGATKRRVDGNEAPSVWRAVDEVVIDRGWTPIAESEVPRRARTLGVPMRTTKHSVHQVFAVRRRQA